jgi:DNA transformation protein
VKSEDEAAVALAGELFAELGMVRPRRMFGGVGLYVGEVMFALIDDGRIYLKTDEALKADLAAAGARSWLYTERKGPKAGIPQETSYWSLPDAACDDADEACAWARRALQAAAALRAAAPARRRRPASAATGRRR